MLTVHKEHEQAPLDELVWQTLKPKSGFEVAFSIAR